MTYDTDGAPCCYGFAAGAPDPAPDCPDRGPATGQLLDEVRDDALVIFDKLLAEVRAGRCLIALTEPGARHRAAVAALSLCADVLEDGQAAVSLIDEAASC